MLLFSILMTAVKAVMYGVGDTYIDESYRSLETR